jgi:hypothetical protein
VIDDRLQESGSSSSTGALLAGVSGILVETIPERLGCPRENRVLGVFRPAQRPGVCVFRSSSVRPSSRSHITLVAFRIVQHIQDRTGIIARALERGEFSPRLL